MTPVRPYDRIDAVTVFIDCKCGRLFAVHPVERGGATHQKCPACACAWNVTVSGVGSISVTEAVP